MLAGSRPKVVLHTSWSAAFAVEIWARLRQMTSTVWKNDFGTLLYNNSSTLASGKTRVARKTSKTTPLWFLASNSKDMPLVMKCQVNSEKSQIFRNAKPMRSLLGKPVATYNFATSLFGTTQSPSRPNLDEGQVVTSCPKVVYNSRTAAFAVENSRGTLLLQHQQIHACHWQD